MKKNKTKITSIMLAIALLTSSAVVCNISANAAETDTDTGTVKMLGDATGDGTITVADATIVQLAVSEGTEFTDDQTLIMDTNQDGKVTVADATFIQLYATHYDAFTNPNIGKIYHDAEYKTVTHPAEVGKAKLRYELINCNACSVCNEPLVHKETGEKFTDAEITGHMFGKHNGGSWRTENVWFYVDDDDIYHDLSDDWKVPNSNCWRPDDEYHDTDYWDEGSMNVFDVGFNPYNGAFAQDAYNSTHENKLNYYWATTVESHCSDCNSDGTSVYIDDYKKDENGNWIGCLQLMDPVEITVYPKDMADKTALNEAKEKGEQIVAKHKAWHAATDGETHIQAFTTLHKKIYEPVTIKDAWTETVLVRDAGWY